jgi:uncharacterized protein YdiU (UPF0061 family)
MARSEDLTLQNNPMGWAFDNTYTRLPELLYASAAPARFPAPRLVVLNGSLARELGLDFAAVPPDSIAALFSGQELPEGAQPIAQAYAGHQYGGFTMLGDGRAILLGEHRTPSGKLVDIQLKGPGQTPFSRRGDGRAALGPMLREYLISEAMNALGIPTTHSLAVVSTGEAIHRGPMLPGAVLTRVASSHIRVGTFEYLAARKDTASLQALADYSIRRHYPDLVDGPSRYLDFLRAVIDRQAALIARWQGIGFIHGVMNTDNMSISGETIDYGPCAFMNAFDPATVFSSIDHGGRYAYGNQPRIALWNLTRFAESLLSLLATDVDDAVKVATEALEGFAARFEKHWLAGMRQKLGLTTADPEDLDLVQSLLNWMHKTGADFTNTFRDLSTRRCTEEQGTPNAEYEAWLASWHQRLQREHRTVEEAQSTMRTVNPAVIPRNHRVEAALSAAEGGDLSLFNELLQVVTHPFDLSEENAHYREPSPDDASYRTFCGT